MEQDDKEFEQLLEEIPRATSAPPHLEELQRQASASRLSENLSGSSLDNLLYSHFSSFSSNTPADQLSSIHSGLALDTFPDHFGDTISTNRSSGHHQTLSSAMKALNINLERQLFLNTRSQKENSDEKSVIYSPFVDKFANNPSKSSGVQFMEQRAFSGQRNVPSDLTLRQVFPAPMLQAYSSEGDGLARGFPHHQKQLHQVNAMQAAQFELYPPSLNHQIPHNVSNLHPQQCAAATHQPQQLQIQHMQQRYYTQHLQEQQLRGLLCDQDEAASGAFVTHFPNGFTSQAVPAAAPSTVGLSILQHPLPQRIQQHVGTIEEKGWREWRPQATPLKVLDYASSCQSGDLSCSYAQDSCHRISGRPFLHSSSQASVPLDASKDSKMSVALKSESKNRLHGHMHLLERRSTGKNATSVEIKNKGIAHEHHNLLANAYDNQIAEPKLSDYAFEDLLKPQLERHIATPFSTHNQQQQFKYTSLQEVEGLIFAIAKDQHGCRFLQKKFDEGDPEETQMIFSEIVDHIVELMTDPFGNYLVQKLLDVCNEVQRTKILHAVIVKGELITISLNMHGTRAVQKLIETSKSPDQIAMLTSSLRQGVVTLIKDLNGNHVIQRCLQRLSNEDNEFIFDAAASNCVQIATHRHGCCVLQRCVDFASGAQRERVVAEVAANALVLSQDQYGNYVVQYVLDLGIPWASVEVMIRLEGSYALLSMQKFSSNVVEKCLKQAGDENRTCIVNELMGDTVLGQLLQDPYANYVVQCALSVTKGALHTTLVEAIRPHSPTLRSSPYGKRILSRTNLKR